MRVVTPPTQGTHEHFLEAFPVEADCIHCEAELLLDDPEEVGIEVRSGTCLLGYTCIVCRGYNEEDTNNFDITQATARAEISFRKNPLRHGLALQPKEV